MNFTFVFIRRFRIRQGLDSILIDFVRILTVAVILGLASKRQRVHESAILLRISQRRRHNVSHECAHIIKIEQHREVGVHVVDRVLVNRHSGFPTSNKRQVVHWVTQSRDYMTSFISGTMRSNVRSTYPFSRRCWISRRMILGIIASATHIKSDGASDLFTAAFGPCLSQKLKMQNCAC